MYCMHCVQCSVGNVLNCNYYNVIEIIVLYPVCYMYCILCIVFYASVRIYSNIALLISNI